MAETTRDYSSIFSIKDYAIKDIAPKFFEMEDVNTLNSGLIGYSTEVVATIGEDVFNTVSQYTKEIFPNQASIPETLYGYAADLQIDNLFATPSELDVAIFVNIRDIVNNGERKESFYEFKLDSDLIVDIEGQQFMLDYDITITAKPSGTSYIFVSQYELTHTNSLSTISNPYIKNIIQPINNVPYLALLVKMRRVNKFKKIETIINNDKINLPTIDVEFIDQLASFEVFYKSPTATDYIQLQKKLTGSTPSSEPFCFYALKDENKIQISFSARDNYFQPEFNSELLIVSYTTTGSKGDFSEYKGTQISVIPSSEVYDYNNNLILFAFPQGESRFGKDKLTLDELRRKITELRSTSGAYNSETDLQLYFDNYANSDRNTVMFIKKRDDALERLFSAFSLFKDLENNFYPTNTLNISVPKDGFDIQYEQSNRYILKAGHLFTYDASVNDVVVKHPSKTIVNDFSDIKEDFIYTNPFLLVLQQNPNTVGLYLNSLNRKAALDYTYVNSDSQMQFICNNVNITRNALIGEDFYTLSVTLIPASPLEMPTLDETTGEYNSRLKIMLTIEDNGTELCYKNMDFAGYDAVNDIYTFSTKISTDDYMTISEKFTVLNMKDIQTDEEISNLVPMHDCIINIYSMYRYDNYKVAHQFDNIVEYGEHTLTNKYSTITSKVDFILPLDIMRGRVQYRPTNDGQDYYFLFSSVPLIGAADIKDGSMDFTDFINLMFNQYEYMQDIVDKKTNSYGIDMKFYNTFGRSKNFVVGEDGAILDRTNISIHFKVAPVLGAVEDEMLTNVRNLIKTYIEGINQQGTNVIYISNLITEIENNIDDVKYLKFVKINNYDSSVQVIENRASDLNMLTKNDRRDYVPEYLTINTDDIILDIIRG